MGAFRFVLAFFVLASHLWAGMPHGFAAYAVWGFFVLSGYLMTYVLREKYGFSRAGLAAYGRNRFLRILPTYWLALVLGVVAIVVLGARGYDLTRLNPSFAMPKTPREWLFPLTLLVVFPVGRLPVAVSNALGIEVSVYLLMPLLARHRVVAWATLAFATLVHLRLGFGLDTFAERYATFLPCLWPFAVGSLLAHHRERLAPLAKPLPACAAWMLHGLVWFRWDQWPWTFGLYSSVILSAWVVLSLAERKSSGLDTLLGDLSYPLYLFHTIVGAWLLPIFGFERRFGFFAVASASVLAVSWSVVRLFERPLKALKVGGPSKA